MIETGRFVLGLSNADMDAFRFPVAVLGFRCDAREEGGRKRLQSIMSETTSKLHGSSAILPTPLLHLISSIKPLANSRKANSLNSGFS